MSSNPKPPPLTVKKYTQNPRTISKAEVQRLRRDLEEFGDLGGIVHNVEKNVETEGQLVGGHQRLEIMFGANDAGEFKISNAQIEIVKRYDPPTRTGTVAEGYVIFKGERFTYRQVVWEDDMFRRANVRANKAGGKWDWDALANVFDEGELQGMGFDHEFLEESKSNSLNLASMFSSEEEERRTTQAMNDKTREQAKQTLDELVEKWGTAAGQKWKIGEHSLVCGDCLDPEILKLALDGVTPQILMTSPPYFIGKEYEVQKAWPDVLAFIAGFCQTYAPVVAQNGRIIVNTGTAQTGQIEKKPARTRLLVDLYVNAFEPLGWDMRYVRFWVKSGGIGFGSPSLQTDVIDAHTEFIAYFYNPKAKKFRGMERVGQGWATMGYWDDVRGEARANNHSAAFPLAIPERNIQLFTRKGEVVLDPFMGSGTTMVAAENLSRASVGVERLPEYVAVSLERMKNLFPDIEIERVV